ncbi:LpqN/LpqT family lipoprotein [Nocardia vaccinii]|uniref:LpqN/LpqT family lipoprotein n=1 Tax=Nocardia vaccinii TaxID=1822 RepID=UPI00082BAA07|nr:LpqN/LpqT family lipoprotein [Nocardia vaccinii]
MNVASQNEIPRERDSDEQALLEQTLPTISEFLAAVGATPVVVHPEYPGVPVVLLDIPGDWHEVVREVLPNAFGAWALPAGEGSSSEESGWVENAVLMVWRLSLPVDPRAVMRCAYTDSRRLPDWVELGGDVEDYDGFPSAEISGTYSYAGLSLWMSTRYLVASTPTGQYLLQLTVTTFADEISEGVFIAESFTVQVPPARPGPGAHEQRLSPETGAQLPVDDLAAEFRSGVYDPEPESRWRQADSGVAVESFEPQSAARPYEFEHSAEPNFPDTGSHSVVREFESVIFVQEPSVGFDTPAEGYETSGGQLDLPVREYESSDRDAYSAIMGVEPQPAESDSRESYRREPDAPSTGNMDFRI